MTLSSIQCLTTSSSQVASTRVNPPSASPATKTLSKRTSQPTLGSPQRAKKAKKGIPTSLAGASLQASVIETSLTPEALLANPPSSSVISPLTVVSVASTQTTSVTQITEGVETSAATAEQPLLFSTIFSSPPSLVFTRVHDVSVPVLPDTETLTTGPEVAPLDAPQHTDVHPLEDIFAQASDNPFDVTEGPSGTISSYPFFSSNQEPFAHISSFADAPLVPPSGTGEREKDDGGDAGVRTSVADEEEGDEDYDMASDIKLLLPAVDTVLSKVKEVHQEMPRQGDLDAN